MANFLTDDIVSLESLDKFESNLVAAKHSDRKWEAYFGTHGGSNRGDSFRIRKPNFEEVRTGWTADWKETDEDYTSITFGEPIGVDKILTDKEMHMDLSSEGKQIIDSVMNSLSHKVDSMAVDEVMTAPNYVGIPGSNPAALSTYMNGLAILRDRLVPEDEMVLNAISPQMEVDAVDFLKGLSQDDAELSHQYKKGRVRRAGGLLWAMTQQTKTHTTGSVAGSLLVNQPASLANGATSIALDDATASQTGVLKRNDILHFDGMNMCHPITKEDTGRRMTVRVTADADSDGSGNVTAYFEPALYFSGPKQNVTAQPTNNGVVYLFGHATAYASTTARQGLMWHKSALACAYQKLDNADGEGVKGRTVNDDKLGMSIRYTRRWDQDIAKWKLRWDVWVVFKLVRPEWALRIQSGS